MKILILGLNHAPEEIGIAVYTTGLAETLARWGHEVQVVAGQPYYPRWKVTPGFRCFWFSRSREGGVDVTRVPHYVPARPSGGKRLLHHLSFSLAALFPMIFRALRSRPDIVLAVAPSLIASPVAWLAARICGAKSWLHVQDFEVEAAFATGLLQKTDALASLAAAFERQTLRGHDVVSSISPKMCARLAEKGVAAERIWEFRNWVDVDAIRPLDRPSTYRQEWGIATEHVALYSGSIANKQGIDIILDAARVLAGRTDLTFVICGEGPEREALQRRANGLGNVRFHDLQPRERLCDLLGLASVHLLPQLAGAADLVLPSKLCAMLASGRPVVVTAARGTGLAEEADGCGIVTPPGDAVLLADAIEQILDDAALREPAGAEARRRAESRWARTAILRRAEAQLLELVADGKVDAAARTEAPLP